MNKECLSRELRLEIIVGVFVLMVFLGLGYFTIILSQEAWFQKKYPLEVVFEDVMGLRDGDSVVVRGMPVGKVRTLVLKEDGVHVTLSLDQAVQLRTDYKIVIVTTSILGGRYLEILEGNAPDFLPEGVLLAGRKPQNLMQDAAEAVNAIQQGLMEGGIIDNMKKTFAEFAAISERINQGKGSLGKLLSEDETIYDDIKATTASLKEISGRLENGEGTLGKLMSKEDTLYSDLSATMASLKSITARIESGEGTLGKLVQDDKAYTELTKAIEDARAALDDFRENTPVVTFTSILFGAW